MKSFAGFQVTYLCECSDKLCPAHTGRKCEAKASVTLERIDFAGCPEVYACEPCGLDMLDSGVFGIPTESEDEDLR